MRFSDKVNFAKDLFVCRALNIHVPLIVNWAVTNQCTQKCLYCNIPHIKSEELSTGEALSLITQIRVGGTRILAITGGEPLLRKDIGLLINHASKQGLIVKLKSNGAFVKDRFFELKSVDEFRLSLDGYEEIHDSLRGEGSYNSALDAIRYLQENNSNVSLTCVLTKLNIESILFLANFAKEHKCPIAFQPVIDLPFGYAQVKDLSPPRDIFAKAIKDIMRIKKNNRYISNSVDGLKYLLNWPNKMPINCVARKISCYIRTDGEVYTCGRSFETSAGNCRNDNFIKIFQSIGTPNCEGCWCSGSLEIYYLYNFSHLAIYNNLIH